MYYTNYYPYNYYAIGGYLSPEDPPAEDYRDYMPNFRLPGYDLYDDFEAAKQNRGSKQGNYLNAMFTDFPVIGHTLSAISRRDRKMVENAVRNYYLTGQKDAMLPERFWYNLDNNINVKQQNKKKRDQRRIDRAKAAGQGVTIYPMR